MGPHRSSLGATKEGFLWKWNPTWVWKKGQEFASGGRHFREMELIVWSPPDGVKAWLVCWGNWGTWGMGGREWAKHTGIPAEEFSLDLEGLQILCLIFGVSYVLIWRVGKSERETLKYRSSVLTIYLLFFFKWLALLTSVYFSKKLYISAISGKLKMPDVFWNSDFFSDSERWYNAYT